MRELSLGPSGVATKQVLGYGEAYHSVAQELQPLVRFGEDTRVLVGERTVHQSKAQQFPVLEGNAEATLQSIEVTFSGHFNPPRLHLPVLALDCALGVAVGFGRIGGALAAALAVDDLAHLLY